MSFYISFKFRLGETFFYRLRNSLTDIINRLWVHKDCTSIIVFLWSAKIRENHFTTVCSTFKSDHSYAFKHRR